MTVSGASGCLSQIFCSSYVSEEVGVTHSISRGGSVSQADCRLLARISHVSLPDQCMMLSYYFFASSRASMSVCKTFQDVNV